MLKQEAIAELQTARTDALKVKDTNYGEAPRCEVCGQYVGLRQWLPPYRLELETWGHVFADLVVIGTDLLISQRVKQAWEQSHLVGLNGFEQVEVVKLKRHRKAIGDPPVYFRAVVTRSQTEIDFAASGFEWGKAPTCPTCRLGDVIKRWNRIVINQQTWNGEDVFIARGLPGEIIASERFKEFCEHNNVTNVALVSAESSGHDFCPTEHGTAPPLDIDVGSKIARIIGIHPVVAAEPCHLIEVEINDQGKQFNWATVTQEDSEQPRSNWQVAYDETPLDNEGTRWAFFFHYLDISRPLLTSAGSLDLPTPTPLPRRLEYMKYVEP